VNCGELLEVFYPAWEKADPSHAEELRALWLERRKSLHALDQSGVWRFRELLPGMLDWNKVITLRKAIRLSLSCRGVRRALGCGG